MFGRGAKMKFSSSQNWLLVLGALFLGFSISHFGPLLVQKYNRYFSLEGYSRITDYKLKPRQSGATANFALLDVNGEGHELYRYSDAKAIVIISHGNDCPIVQKYAMTISGLKKEYETREVRFFMLNSGRIS